MWRKHLWSLLIVAVAPGAGAAELASHRVVYDLALRTDLPGMKGGEGRIVIELRESACGVFETQYRFVAKFEREDATVVTDQQTVTTEDIARATFDFRTETFVGGRPESLIEGRAVNEENSTIVELESPEPRSFDIALSVFPTAHLSDLIEKAQAGETLVQTSIYDGDNEADKRLTTTAVISPLPSDGSREQTRKAPPPELADLRAWRVHESYYISDNDADGLPLFQSTYDLYENGVSENLVLDTGDYAFSGGITSLEVLDGPRCD